MAIMPRVPSSEPLPQFRLHFLLRLFFVIYCVCILRECMVYLIVPLRVVVCVTFVISCAVLLIRAVCLNEEAC